MIGQAQDARPLLTFFGEEPCGELDPDSIAQIIFFAAKLPTSQPLTAWDRLWPESVYLVTEFLLALEQKARTPELARRAQKKLEQLIIEHSQLPRPLTIGTTYATQIEVTEPIPDIAAPQGVESLHCRVEVAGRSLGEVLLPVCDGRIPSAVLADAIVAEFTWPILGAFFEATLYPTFDVDRETPRLSVRRGSPH